MSTVEQEQHHEENVEEESSGEEEEEQQQQQTEEQKMEIMKQQEAKFAQKSGGKYPQMKQKGLIRKVLNMNFFQIFFLSNNHIRIVNFLIVQIIN